jgi:lysophospholipase L1-like esterase
MTILAAGASATVTLSADEQLQTTGAGTAVYGPGPLRGQPVGLFGPSTIGPFDREQVVYLTGGSGGLEYGEAAPPFPPSYPADDFTSEQVAATQALVSGGGIRGKKLLILGSSNAAGAISSTFTGDPNEAGGWASCSTSWAGLLAAALGASWTVVNRSVSGQSVVTAATRLQALLVEHSPSHVIIANHPLNDAYDFAAMKTAITSMVGWCRQIGVVPILRGAYAAPDMTTAQIAICRTFNAELDKLGCRRIDHWSTLTNDSTGALINTSIDAGDRLHLNDAGHAAMFRAIDLGMFEPGAAQLENTSGGSWKVDNSSTTQTGLMVRPQLPLYAWSVRFKHRGASGAATGRVLFAAGELADGSDHPQLRVITHSTGVYRMLSKDAGVDVTSTVNPTTDSTTHDIVVTYNDITSSLALYIDGTLIGAGTRAVQAIRVLTFGATPNNNANGAAGYSYADCAVWPVALTAKAISEMYRTGKTQPAGLIALCDMSRDPAGTGPTPFTPVTSTSTQIGGAVWLPVAAI